MCCCLFCFEQNGFFQGKKTIKFIPDFFLFSERFVRCSHFSVRRTIVFFANLRAIVMVLLRNRSAESKEHHVILCRLKLTDLVHFPLHVLTQVLPKDEMIHLMTTMNTIVVNHLCFMKLLDGPSGVTQKLLKNKGAGLIWFPLFQLIQIPYCG